MQEREELRALKREIKMSREGKVKRKICVWKRKERKKENEREKRRKRKEVEWQERYEVDESSK
jgi:hypothetical protein